MSTRATRWAALLVVVAVAVSACAAGPNPAVDAGANPAGFWLGLWQGFISPIALLVSFFRDDVNIYEVHNNGNWYDFGFVLGVSMFFGGGGGASGRGRSRRRRSRADSQG